MGAEFERVWLLLLLVPAAAAVILPYLGRRWDFRLRLTAALRLFILLLLTLAMAGMSFVFPGGDQALLVAADRSDSMKAHYDEEITLIDSVEKQKGRADTGLMAFGGNTAVEYLEGTGKFTGFDTRVQSSATDIAGALEMGAALLPQDAVRRMLLVTDGLENSGDLLSAARMLSAAGIRMDVAYYPPEPSGEAQATSLAAPGYLHIGERFDVVVTVHSTVAGKATLRLYCDRTQAGEQEVELQKGENRYVFTLTADRDGIHTWTAEISAAWDGNAGNNRADAYTKVIGRPQVLLASDAPEETETLGRILESAGFIVDRRGTAALPGSLDEYMKYRAVVLCNVPAASIGDAAMAALDAYVRVLGRGLLVTGGQDSFALGGYEGTKLEEMLPVNSRVENYAEMPKLGLVLVVDKSGSMGDGQYGISKRDLAVEAAARSVEIIQPRDDVGVVAFDDQAAWAVPFASAQDKQAIQDMIASIRIGGGTMMFTPLTMARDALAGSDAKLKHVILLTDGMPADSGFDDVVKGMKAGGVTLSTVAVGKDADTALLARLSDLGGGRAYVVDEFSNIVSVFAKETYLATGAYLQNRTFTPAATPLAPAALSQGLPALHGYVNTTPKETAEIELVSDRDHVIYARRRYGLGRTAVWTSDMKGLWTQDLLSSQSAVKIVSSLVSQVMPEEEGSGDLEASVENGQGVVRMQAPTDEGASVTATVVAPDNTSFDIDLQPVRPGEYEARFDASQPGTYVVRATQKQPGVPDVTTETGLSAGWSREYDLRYDDPKPRLEEAARITGGRLVSSAEELFAESMEMKRGRADPTGPLVLAALFLFVLDVAVRRMRWDARLLAWLKAMKIRIKGKKPVVSAAAGAPAPAALGARPAAAAQPPGPENEADAIEMKNRAETGKTSADAPAPAPSSAAAALLEKRKQQKR